MKDEGTSPFRIQALAENAGGMVGRNIPHAAPSWVLFKELAPGNMGGSKHITRRDKLYITLIPFANPHHGVFPRCHQHHRPHFYFASLYFLLILVNSIVKHKIQCIYLPL